MSIMSPEVSKRNRTVQRKLYRLMQEYKYEFEVKNNLLLPEEFKSLVKKHFKELWE